MANKAEFTVCDQTASGFNVRKKIARLWRSRVELQDRSSRACPWAT